MLRIHFTGDDLQRVRIAPGPDPAWETALALYRLYGGEQPGGHGDRWRERAARTLYELGLQQRFAPLRNLVTAYRTASPADAVAGLARHLAREPHTARLFQQALITPHWSRMTGAVAADRAARMRRQADGGLVGLFDSLRPHAAWRVPVLQVSCGTSPREIRLDGRGLHLVPAYFCADSPLVSLDSAGSVVLVHPLLRERLPERGLGGATRDAALGRVLGHTRARILRAAGHNLTTGELATLLTVSQATASEHTKALREAGLTARCRSRGHSVHTLTRLGAALLRGEGLPVPSDRP